MAFDIRYTPLALDHLRSLTTRNQAIVVDAVDDQLAEQANVSTRNRKPLRPNQLATWELRLGNLRVFYNIEMGTGDATAQIGELPVGVVVVVAVGIKRGNRLLISGEEFEL